MRHCAPIATMSIIMRQHSGYVASLGDESVGGSRRDKVLQEVLLPRCLVNFNVCRRGVVTIPHRSDLDDVVLLMQLVDIRKDVVV